MKNPLTGGPTRDRTYQAFGEDDLPIGATVTERVTDAVTGGSPRFINNPNSSNDRPDGRFRDQLGLHKDQSGIAYLHQTFTTSLPGGPPNVPTVIRIMNPDGKTYTEWGTLAYEISAGLDANDNRWYNVKFATVDGGKKYDEGMWNKDGTPRLPICPQY